MLAQYSYNIEEFKNQKVDPDSLTKEITTSTITVALDHIELYETYCAMFFKAELSDADEDTLTEIVHNHEGIHTQDVPYIKAEVLSDRIENIARNPLKEIYEAQSYIINIDSSFNELIVKWPFEIILIAGTIQITDEMIGDHLNVHIAPNTLIGALTAPLNVGDTSCYVSDTVLQNTRYGEYLNIYTPEEDSCGVLIARIKEVDIPNKRIVFVEPAAVPANAGTYVSKTIIMLPHIQFANTQNIAIGQNITSGQRIPPGISLHVHYYADNGITNKKASFFLEYLY